MPRTIIVDTDPGVDDVLAILLALASPELHVKLISIVFGNTHAPMAQANLLKIYHVLQNELAAFPVDTLRRYPGLGDGEKKLKGKTRLAVGADGPVGGEKATAAYFVSHSFSTTLTLLHQLLYWWMVCFDWQMLYSADLIARQRRSVQSDRQSSTLHSSSSIGV